MLVIRHEKRKPLGFPFTLLAESEGFKPPIPERGIPDFESSAIDHSANSPDCGCKDKEKNRNSQIYFSKSCLSAAFSFRRGRPVGANSFERELRQPVSELLGL